MSASAYYGDARGAPPSGTHGYPPSGYPAHGAYPPQHAAGYPPQSGYPPPPQGAYPPPQGPGYPPQQGGGFPPQQGGFGFAPPPGPPPGAAYGGGYPPAPGYGPPSAGHGPPPGPPPAPHGAYGQPFASGAAPGGPPGGGYTYLGVPVPPPPPHQPLAASPAWDVGGHVERIYKAMKGFGTDDKTLIRELCTQHDPFVIDAVRTGYKQYKGKDLMKAVEGDVSGWYEAVLRFQVYGPVMGDVVALHRAMKGAGTDEPVLTEILLGRSNADVHILKSAYHATYNKRLEDAVAGELSFKTKRMFAQALAGVREEHAPVNPQQVEEDVRRLYTAMRGAGTDEDAITSILLARNDAQLVAIAQRYRQVHHKALSSALSGDFSGHMQEGLLYIATGAEDPAGVHGYGVQRDARLIHDAMEGAGTKDRNLVRRVCRASWNRHRFQAVKQAYRQLYKQDLVTRIKRETSGNYEKSLVTVVETA